MKFVQEPPDGKTRNHIECTVSKIGEAANSVNQRKPNGHQGKRKTIDDAVDENVHNRLNANCKVINAKLTI
jgi:hypothetical protein